MVEDISDDYMQYCEFADTSCELGGFDEYDAKAWDRADGTDDVDQLVADFMRYWRTHG